MLSPIERARSFLFVPGSRPERFNKAFESGADCVIVDLEDAVAPNEKDTARGHLADRLPHFKASQLARTLVRINGVDTPWHAQDLDLLARWIPAGLSGVIVPKAEAVSALDAIAAMIGSGARMVPLIESVAGLDAVHLIARRPQVLRLAFGHLDFQLDAGMRCSADEPELAAVRFTLVAAARRARLPAPIDGVTTETSDENRLAADAVRSRNFGFGGKLCIHPAQVAAVNQAFSPSTAEVEWARRVIAAARAHEGRAFSMDGRMVDLPVIKLAQQTLESQPGTR
jgi:citrate lyase subunit beta/citryl-CoA lyase